MDCKERTASPSQSPNNSCTCGPLLSMSCLTSDQVVVYSQMSSMLVVRQEVKAQICELIACTLSRMGKEVSENALSMMGMASRSGL
jgi:hypothetical protein